MSAKQKKKPVPRWVKTTGAMAGGVVEACALQPLDVIKTRLQVRVFPMIALRAIIMVHGATPRRN